MESEEEEVLGEFVIPGDVIGTVEEFTPMECTYERNGDIYASATGIVKVNPRRRTISVKPLTATPPRIEVGDTVLGRITDLRESVALVEIAQVQGEGERQIVNLAPAAIHVSNVKDSYVKELYHEFTPFDIVKARVIDLKNMRLSTQDKDMGVVKAYCSGCKTPLKLENGKLKCPKCERVERRKISSSYGTGIF